MSRPPKLYGTFMPTWTPANFEFGLFGALRPRAGATPSTRPAAGNAESVSFPSSRRVSFMSRSLLDDLGSLPLEPPTFTDAAAA